MKFEYKARVNPQETTSGIIEAENSAGAAQALRKKGLYPLDLHPLSGTNTRPGKNLKISSRDLTSFTRQLANLVRSGFTLPKAIQTLRQQTHKPALAQVLDELYLKINKGKTFSEALRAYPAIFSSFYLSMVRIGETGGSLDTALEKLAEAQEKRQEILTQVRSALAYPSFLSAVGIVTVFVLLAFVIPRLAQMFEDLGQALPLATQMVMQFSGFMSRFWWLVVILLCSFILFARYFYLNEKNRLLIDRALLSLPGARGLIQKVEIANFSHGLGVLLSNGVPVVDALNVVSSSVGNRYVRLKFSSFPEKIRQGQTLKNCFSSDTFFPPVLANMAAVGEESGDLARMLLNTAESYEKEINASVKSLVSLLEPSLIVILGAIIAFLAFSMLLPVFDINFLVE